jgi:carbon monoxide dehydrogenase subunit G
MRIDHEFTVPAPIETTWPLLTDVEAIAPCMPGARLTGVEPAAEGAAEGAAETYLGTVKVKIGPVGAEYAGSARFLEKDDAAHRGVIEAKGKDSRGAGNASAVIVVMLAPAAAAPGAETAGTTVTIETELKISGKVAQLGGGLIKEVSRKLLGQFVECLEGRLTPAPPTPAVTGTGTSTGTGTGTGPALDAAPELPADAGGRAGEPQPEQAALDLLALAGGSATVRRAAPVALGVLALLVAAVVVIARRRR